MRSAGAIYAAEIAAGASISRSSHVVALGLAMI